MRIDLSSVEFWEISYITTHILAESGSAHQAASRVLHLLGTRFDARYTAFWVLDEVEPGIKCAELWPDDETATDFAKVSKSRIFRLGEGLPGRAWESKGVVWEPNVTISSNFPRASVARAASLKTGVAFPVFSARSILAVIEIFGDDEHSPTPGVIDFLNSLGGQIGVFIEHFDMARALSESEAEFCLVADSARDVVITIDDNSTVIFANAAVYELLGYTASELIGNSLTVVMPEPLRVRHKEGLERYLKTGVRNLDWNEIRLPALHKDGSFVDITIAFGQFWRNGKRVFTGFAKRVAG